MRQCSSGAEEKNNLSKSSPFSSSPVRRSSGCRAWRGLVGACGSAKPAETMARSLRQPNNQAGATPSSTVSLPLGRYANGACTYKSVRTRASERDINAVPQAKSTRLSIGTRGKALPVPITPAHCRMRPTSAVGRQPSANLCKSFNATMQLVAGTRGNPRRGGRGLQWRKIDPHSVGREPRARKYVRRNTVSDG